jgi:hypothetical protein
VQALALLLQLLRARDAVSDRFYRALYAVLLHEVGQCRLKPVDTPVESAFVS